MLNKKCTKCYKSTSHEEQNVKSKVLPDDDHHPFIVKNSGNVQFDQLGVGYELFNAMNRYTNQICEYIEATNESQTYGDILRNAKSIAIKLRTNGLNEDSIICLCLPNAKHTITIYLAGLFVGCKMNFLDMTFQINDIAFFLNVVTPDLLIANINKVADIKAALKQISVDVDVITVGGEIDGNESLLDYLEAPQKEIQKFKPYKVDSLHRICLILFSSGTAGPPKGICLSHLNMLYQFYHSATTGNYVKTLLVYASLYWISSTVLTCASLLGGISRIISTNNDCTHIYKLIDKCKITSSFFGPFQCMMFANTPKPPDIDTSSLRCIMVGGAILKDFVWKGLREIFQNCLLCQVYGLTEAGGTVLKFALNSTNEVKLAIAKHTCCGMPHANYWYKIVDEETGQILGPNQIGELCIKSEAVMSGYYKRDSSDNFDGSGWLKTGDLFYYDEYRCFYFIDRIKEVIKCRGWHISPSNIEEILITHPAVARAVVVGIPHDEDLEQPVGLITLKEGIDPASVDLNEITEFVNSRVPDIKHLRGGVRIVHNILYTASGKVKRRIMRDSLISGKEM